MQAFRIDISPLLLIVKESNEKYIFNVFSIYKTLWHIEMAKYKIRNFKSS